MSAAGMPAATHLQSFVLATLAFTLLPGPALLYTAAQTLARGRAAGLRAALGLHCGGYFHILLVSAGLAALLRYVPPLFLAIRLAGALYLVWLGIGVLRAADPSPAHPAEAGSASVRRAFAQSVAVEVLNPKSALFYLAFLPQFVDVGAALPVWVQLACYGVCANAMFSAADVAVTLFAGRVLQSLRRSSLGLRVARWTSGSLLIGLGARLAAAR